MIEVTFFIDSSSTWGDWQQNMEVPLVLQEYLWEETKYKWHVL